ncbi:Uncharacterised protein [Mycobacteroides abscessus subsp. abscessus]|nr:Uncharacterised protein [Mycobacteroides abscessus subsp. abscessus]SKT26520.1 Uncharacterised protein [Mycobacteroides abscessus subsp. abscessus]
MIHCTDATLSSLVICCAAFSRSPILAEVRRSSGARMRIMSGFICPAGKCS